MGEKPSCVDELYGMEALDSLLPGADVVAMSLPGNPSTYHILNRERIALLSPGTIVLNAGRGTAIDTDALCEALYAGKIAGAALDVTDPEPLFIERHLLGEQLLDQLGDRRNADVQLLGQIGERRIAGDGHMSDNITLDDVVLLNNAFSLSMLGPVEKLSLIHI